MTTATASPTKQAPIVNRKLVPLARLTNAPWNPPRRTEAPRLRKLADSMDRLGLLNAVVINHEHQIIDGHRRTAAARLLGWESVECVIVSNDNDASAIYSSVNESSAKHSGNDLIVVWLKNPDAVPERQAALLKGMEAELGRRLVTEIAREGWTYRVFRLACQLARYCESPQLAKEFTVWLMRHGQMGVVHKMLSQGVAPRIFEAARKRDKPVVFQAAVGE